MLKSFNFFTSKEDKEIKNEPARIVRSGYSSRDSSPCPCGDCNSWKTKLQSEIATITKKMEVAPMTVNSPATSTIIGVSGMGHLSAESYIKPERKDESKPNGGAGVSSKEH